MTADQESAVAAHYTVPGLLDIIDAGLRAVNADPIHPTIADLAPVDEFHTAGRITTLKALDMAGIAAGMHVLDAGCGLGGTARVLAAERECSVTGIDLTPEFIDVARTLTERMGLGDRCTFDVGSVTALPYGYSTFDAAVTMHVAMNIEDRASFYGALARVVRPGGTLCVFDVMKGPAEGMRFPVPWAETGATSFLKSAPETRSLLQKSGFEVTQEESQRLFAIDYFEEVFAAIAKNGGPPPVGLHLLTGSNAPEKFTNYMEMARAEQIDPVIMIARRLG